MNDNLELYLEEQRILTIGLLDSVKLLNTKIDKQIEQYSAPLKEVGVSGRVEVNTEKSVEVTNLNTIKDWLSEVAQSITKAINDIETHKVVEVKNIANAKTDNVSINNLSELKKYFEILKDTIENKNYDVVVQKQNIVFPKNPKDAIPVRLSDGRSFYNAIFEAISSNNAESDPLAGYQIADEVNDDNTKYYGYTNNKGWWYIMKVFNGAYRFAKGAPQSSGGGLYSDAWNDRANLDYQYYHEVF